MNDVERAREISGTTIRWTWTDGPTAGTTNEHVFREDGTVEWRVAEGPQKGRSGIEREYAAIAIGDGKYLVSYLAASGFTITVVLDFLDHTMTGFASGSGEWYPVRGTFEMVGEQRNEDAA